MTDWKYVCMPSEERAQILKEKAKLVPPPPPKNSDGRPTVFMPPVPKITWPDGITYALCSLGGVRTYAVTDSHGSGETALLHVHGGGFTGGCHASGLKAMLAARMQFGMDGFSVEYTLAPQKKAREILEELLQTYLALRERGYSKIVLAGESAGGNLVIALTLLLKDRRLTIPNAVAASSPVLDFSNRIWRPDIAEQQDLDRIAEAYLGEYSPVHPYVSPIYGDFQGFPPLLLQTGGEENLRLDSLLLAQQLQDIPSCRCTLRIWEGAGHAVGLNAEEDWHSVQCRNEIVRFLAKEAGCEQ